MATQHRFPTTLIGSRLPALLIVFALIVTLYPVPITSAKAEAIPTAPQHDAALAQSNYDHLPLSFIPNTGRIDPAVRFQVRSDAGTLYFTPGEVVLSLSDQKQKSSPIEKIVAPADPPSVVRLRFEGANPAPTMTSTDPLPGIVNEFIGNDSAKWHTNIPTYGSVVYKDLYPGIDLRYDGHTGLLKGTYTVAPHADPTLIRWQYGGTTGAHIDSNSGDLLIDLPNGKTLTEQAPIVWQQYAGQHIPVAVHYTQSDTGEIGFAVGKYDPALPLVIDPTLVFSTYFGGNGVDQNFGITVDGSGNVYSVGYTDSTDFPTSNAVQPTPASGAGDAYVFKLNPTGTTAIYSTYFGGTDAEFAYAIAVDNSGDAFVTGTTYSTDFPTSNAVQPTPGSSTGDGYVFKLNPTGTALIYSTYLGGTGVEQSRGIAVDSSGSAYVTGGTSSADFPTVNALQPKSNGDYDVFVTKLNAAGTALIYSTYLGGTGMDFGRSIVVDSSSSAYVTGIIDSTDFPTVNAVQSTYGGGIYDAFVTKLNPTGTVLVYSTYLGGTRVDDGISIALDSSGSVYIAGYTYSTDFPITSAFQSALAGGADAFVTKLNAAGTALVYSTYLGGSVNEFATGLALDSTNSAFVVGSTGSADFPTVNAFQPTLVGAGDSFLSKLNPTGTALGYSTYLVDNNNSGVISIAIDSSDNIYLNGPSTAAKAPTVNAFQPTFGGGAADAFMTKFNATLVGGGPLDTIGVFRPSTATFYLRNANTTGPADLTTTLGTSTDLPVVGDWNGDGIDTMGIYRPSTGQFFLHDSNATGAPTIYNFVLGAPGDQPMAGDWNNDGKDGVGVFRPSNGLIYLKNGLTTGFADFQMVLGVPGDVPVAGDWNGDGIASPGVYRPSLTKFFLSNQVCNCSVFADYSAALGVVGDSPFAGDWNGDGITGIGVFRPSNGLIYLKNAPTSGFADLSLVYGIANDKPIAGHWAASGPIPNGIPKIAPTFVP